MPGGQEQESLDGVGAQSALCIQHLQVGLVACRSLVPLPRGLVQLGQLVQRQTCMQLTSMLALPCQASLPGAGKADGQVPGLLSITGQPASLHGLYVAFPLQRQQPWMRHSQLSSSGCE